MAESPSENQNTATTHVTWRTFWGFVSVLVLVESSIWIAHNMDVHGDAATVRELHAMKDMLQREVRELSVTLATLENDLKWYAQRCSPRAPAGPYE